MNRQLAQGESKWLGVVVLVLGGVLFTWPLLLNPTRNPFSTILKLFTAPKSAILIEKVVDFFILVIFFQVLF